MGGLLSSRSYFLPSLLALGGLTLKKVLSPFKTLLFKPKLIKFQLSLHFSPHETHIKSPIDTGISSLSLV